MKTVLALALALTVCCAAPGCAHKPKAPPMTPSSQPPPKPVPLYPAGEPLPQPPPN